MRRQIDKDKKSQRAVNQSRSGEASEKTAERDCGGPKRCINILRV